MWLRYIVVNEPAAWLEGFVISRFLLHLRRPHPLEFCDEYYLWLSDWLKPFGWLTAGKLLRLTLVSTNESAFSDKVSNLEFVLDSSLTMKRHVIKICQTAYYELKGISSLRVDVYIMCLIHFIWQQSVCLCTVLFSALSHRACALQTSIIIITLLWLLFRPDITVSVDLA